MTGLEGINSLHKLLGALQVNEATNVNGAAAATSKAAQASSTAQGVSQDSASLSAGGLAAQATETSDVRLTKVAELRQAIANGAYNVSSSDVADKLVQSLLR